MEKNLFLAFSNYMIRFTLFLGTLISALLLALLSIGLRYFIPTLSFQAASTPVLLMIMFFPISLVAFPVGLIAVITQNYEDPYMVKAWINNGIWITYICMTVLGGFIKNRKRFIMLYCAFVILIILNIAGCAIIGPEMLSNIN